MPRALLVHDLRRVFDKKRKEIKALMEQLDGKGGDSSADASAPSDSVDASSSSSSSSDSSVRVTDKACNCKRTICGGNCGCKKNKLGCGKSCVCGGPGRCLSHHSYPKTAEGERQLDEARSRRAEEVRREIAERESRE